MEEQEVVTIETLKNIFGRTTVDYDEDFKILFINRPMKVKEFNLLREMAYEMEPNLTNIILEPDEKIINNNYFVHY